MGKGNKIDGLKLAKTLITQLKNNIASFQTNNVLAKDMITPRLGIIMMGDNPMSQSFIKRKRKYASQAKIKTRLFKIQTQIFPIGSVVFEDVADQIKKLNKDPKYHGILLQLPLDPILAPYQNQLLNLISPIKDVDCLTKESIQIFKKQSQHSKIKPCVVGAVMQIFERYELLKPDLNILIIGKGKLAGAPLYDLFLKKSLKVDIVDINVKKQVFQKQISSSDIILSATGVPLNIQKSQLKKDCVIIDIGCSPDLKNPDKVRGDFDQSVKQSICKYYTPVPKGIGPLVVTSLMQNVYQSWMAQCLSPSQSQSRSRSRSQAQQQQQPK